MQRMDIDLQRAEKAISFRRHGEGSSFPTQSLRSYQLISKGNREHSGQMVVTASSKAYFWNRRNCGIVRDCAQGLDGLGHVGVLQPKQPLPAAGFNRDQAAGKKFRKVRACGLGRYFGRHSESRCRMSVAIQQNGEHLYSSCFADQSGNMRDRGNIHTSIYIESYLRTGALLLKATCGSKGRPNE